MIGPAVVNARVEREDRLICSTPARDGQSPGVDGGGVPAPPPPMRPLTLSVSLGIALSEQSGAVAPSSFAVPANPAHPTPPQFTYYAPPVVSLVMPPIGPVEGGMQITIYGERLHDVHSVTVKSASCAYVKAVPAPPPPPLDDGIGEAGTGAADEGNAIVTCLITRASAGAGWVEVVSRSAGKNERSVAAAGAGKAASPFTFRYAVFPHIETLVPSTAPVGGGTVVQLRGTRLGEAPSLLLAIVVGGRRCRTLTYDSPQSIGCTLPELYNRNGSMVGPNVDVTVHVALAADPLHTFPPLRRLPGAPPPQDLSGSLASNGLSLTVLAQPRISDVRPSSGPTAGGTRLTITGHSLGASRDDLVNVSVGEAPCADVHFVGSKELRCTTRASQTHGEAPLRVVTASRGASVRQPTPPPFVYLPDSPLGAPKPSAAAPAGTGAAASASAADSGTNEGSAMSAKPLNLAKHANASGFCCGRGAANTIDGDENSDWRSPFGVPTANLTLDLGEPFWLSAVTVVWGWEYRATSWDVLLSADGEEWMVVSSGLADAATDRGRASLAVAGEQDAEETTEPRGEGLGAPRRLHAVTTQHRRARPAHHAAFMGNGVARSGVRGLPMECFPT